MITEIEIENYKSLQKLSMEVGRFNILIGENGCGKSNILEAITFAAAAEADKLDNEFLVSRGIRVTAPELMRSGFESKNRNQDIKIALQFTNLSTKKKYDLSNNNEQYSTWVNNGIHLLQMEHLWNEATHIEKDVMQLNRQYSKPPEKSNETKLNIEKLKKSILKETAKRFGNDRDNAEKYLESLQRFGSKESNVNGFIIYSPENTSLRTFSKEGQIQPLGINGEGLLKLLKVIQQQSAQSQQDVTPLDDIKECLALFDWYESIDISSDFAQAEQKITIKDRYLENVFDQRSANEGFLFVLFYIALMVSEDTPKIFAIDNIGASLNPKLCTKLIKELTRLAKKYGKQVFVTTHNPAILDGIDLADDEQRLIVVSRNKQGYTRCKRIGLKDKPKSSTGEPLKLSEAFLRGYLGGLPKGF